MKFKNSKVSILITLLGLATSSLCLQAIDVSSNVSSASFKCALQEGFTHLIVRAYRSSGHIDRNCLGNLRRAHTAGFTTDVYVFPCRGKSASEQGDEVIKLLQIVRQNIKTVWVDIETFSVGKASCFWNSYSSQSNCDFVEQIVGTLQKANYTVGIYSSLTNWQAIMGSSKSCSKFSYLPLWYARYDNKQNFDDYRSFGGWIKPYMKQYLGDKILCDMIVDLNWSPG